MINRLLGLDLAGSRMYLILRGASLYCPLSEARAPARAFVFLVAQAHAYIAEGYQWVVDLDLEKFFDRVNHDLLLARVAERVADKRLLKLIRAFLTAGVMEDGLVSPVDEGTPQGGPLSPLLSNLVLDDLDRELERRGHRFCRYADDCNIYVRSRRAGERVMASVCRFLRQKLRLTVNASKSAVARPDDRTFLGFRLTTGHGPPPWCPRTKKRIRDIPRYTGICRDRGYPFNRSNPDPQLSKGDLRVGAPGSAGVRG